MSPSALRRRVLLSGTMLAAATVGYGRRAYGSVRATPVRSNYLRSGANGYHADPRSKCQQRQRLHRFAGVQRQQRPPCHAITITGDGALSYIDTNTSGLTATAGYRL